MGELYNYFPGKGEFSCSCTVFKQLGFFLKFLFDSQNKISKMQIRYGNKPEQMRE